MHRKDLARILMILIDNCLTSEFTDAHNAVSIIHSVLLYTVNRRIYLASTAVEISGMHMNAQWFSTHLLGMYARTISQPIMCMDNIEIESSGYNACNYRIVVNLLMQI